MAGKSAGGSRHLATYTTSIGKHRSGGTSVDPGNSEKKAKITATKTVKWTGGTSNPKSGAGYVVTGKGKKGGGGC